MYPIPIEQLIKAFAKLPSVGRRSAERFVFHLLKSGKKDVAELGKALHNLMQSIESCQLCWDFSDASPCTICADQKRDQSTICVVAEPQDMRAIERTKQYSGVYHILRGTINPDVEHVGKYIKSQELMNRISKGSITEIILALNPNMRGETTMLFLEKKLAAEATHVKVSRLARGLPMGSDVQYADEITLASALEHRTTK